MQQTTDGVVLHLHKTDEDRILTILTRSEGLVTAYANGANKMRSALASSTELLCYSSFVLFQHRGRFVVDKADSQRIFFGIRSDVEKLSLASYFAQLVRELAPNGEPADPYLSLLLNTLHLLEKDMKPAALLKPIFELRLLTLAGYMPNLVACRECGCYEGFPMLFFPLSGELICSECASHREDTGGGVPLRPGVLGAMRYIIFSQPDKVFSFSLSQSGVAALGKVSEEYLKHQVEKTFTALEFYTGMVLSPGQGPNAT